VCRSFDVGTFQLCDFGPPLAADEVVYSDMLHAHGLSWRLKVYPNGNGVARNSYALLRIPSQSCEAFRSSPFGHSAVLRE
jgi:hypothetical protein